MLGATVADLDLELRRGPGFVLLALLLFFLLSFLFFLPKIRVGGRHPWVPPLDLPLGNPAMV